MSDVRVRINFRNDLLQTLIDEQPLTIRELAKEIGVYTHWLYCVKSLKTPPYSYQGRGIAGEEYSHQAIKCASYFNVSPEVLFPHDIYRIKWPSRLEKKFPVERIAALVESQESRNRALPPHEQLEAKERSEIITEMIDALPPRERTVIQLRFGLGDDEPKTLEEVGEILEVTRERVRQMEIKALKRLHRPLKKGLSDKIPIIHRPVVIQGTPAPEHKKRGRPAGFPGKPWTPETRENIYRARGWPLKKEGENHD